MKKKIIGILLVLVCFSTGLMYAQSCYDVENYISITKNGNSYTLTNMSESHTIRVEYVINNTAATTKQITLKPFETKSFDHYQKVNTIRINFARFCD